MNFLNDADWVQAIIAGLAILASGGIAVWIPHRERQKAEERENRRRLDVTTTRFAPSGLTLEITYRPEFTHVGLYAEVTLLSPKMFLQGMRVASNPAPISGHYVRREADGMFVDGVGAVRLVRLDNEDFFSGSLRLIPESGPLPPTEADKINRARLKFEVWTDARLRLLSTVLEVSPIDEAASYWDR